MDMIPYLAAASAIAALALAAFFYKAVEAAPPGDDRMVFLMTEIQKGARAFLYKEYSWVAIFVVALAIVLAIVIAPLAAVSYILGALLSAGAGFIGMTVATMANARTAEAAKSGAGKALPVAFRGGAVMGFTVAGLALLGLMFTCSSSGSRLIKHLKSSRRSAWADLLSPSSAVSAVASTPRLLTSELTLSARLKQVSLRMIRATRQRSLTTWVTTLETSQEWAPTSSSHTPVQSLPQFR